MRQPFTPRDLALAHVIVEPLSLGLDESFRAQTGLRRLRHSGANRIQDDVPRELEQVRFALDQD